MAAITWTTKEGQEIPVKYLSDNHLGNIIQMLWRNAAHLQSEHYIGAMRYAEDAPDGAAIAAEAEANTVINMEAEDYIQMRFPHIFDEAKRRWPDKEEKLESW
jgi:hypothetical protein